MLAKNKKIKNDKITPFPKSLKGQTGAKVGWRSAGSYKGRGVFAREALQKGELIECQPAIVVAASDVPDDGGAPDGYLFDWDPETKGQEHCMPLGLIMLYNHSRQPNVRMESDYEEMTISVFALRDIAPGEELLWDYNCEIWFDED
jgi:hypothetical protein